MSSLNVVILAGGKSTRDAQRNTGEYPDYLVEHGSTSLIESLIEKAHNLSPEKIVCLFAAEDVGKYHLRNMVSQISPLTSVIPVHTQTLGAACTALLAGGDIDNEEELLIMGSNEFLDVSLSQILSSFRLNGADAGVVTFKSVHPRYSYVKLNDQHDVVESTEKNPISNHAITGTFWFKHGRDFVRAAKNLIRKDTKINGNFYIAPALNEFVLEGKRVTAFRIQTEMYHALKSPTQLQAFEMGAGA